MFSSQKRIKTQDSLDIGPFKPKNTLKLSQTSPNSNFPPISHPTIVSHNAKEYTKLTATINKRFDADK
jgi:hypothetical protein